MLDSVDLPQHDPRGGHQPQRIVPDPATQVDDELRDWHTLTVADTTGFDATGQGTVW
jgi:hypothetical protein